MRDNFRIIKQELEILQQYMNSGGVFVNPVFSGGAQFGSGEFSGLLSAPSINCPLFIPVLTQSPTLAATGAVTAIGNLGAGPAFTLTKHGDGYVRVSGFSTITVAAMGAEVIIGALAGVNEDLRPDQNIFLLAPSGSAVIWQIRIYSDGRIGILNVTGASPLTGIFAIYWSGIYKAA